MHVEPLLRNPQPASRRLEVLGSVAIDRALSLASASTVRSLGQQLEELESMRAPSALSVSGELVRRAGT